VLNILVAYAGLGGTIDIFNNTILPVYSNKYAITAYNKFIDMIAKPI
jgi:hypothetical protein